MVKQIKFRSSIKDRFQNVRSLTDIKDYDNPLVVVVVVVIETRKCDPYSWQCEVRE